MSSRILMGTSAHVVGDAGREEVTPVTVVMEGFLTKRGRISGTKWSRWYQLTADGQLMYKKNAGGPVRGAVYGLKGAFVMPSFSMTARTRIKLVFHNHSCIKLEAESTELARKWVENIIDIASHVSASGAGPPRTHPQRTKRRRSSLQIFVKSTSNFFQGIGGRQTSSSSAGPDPIQTKSPTPPPLFITASTKERIARARGQSHTPTSSTSSSSSSNRFKYLHEDSNEATGPVIPVNVAAQDWIQQRRQSINRMQQKIKRFSESRDSRGSREMTLFELSEARGAEDEEDGERDNTLSHADIQQVGSFKSDSDVQSDPGATEEQTTNGNDGGGGDQVGDGDGDGGGNGDGDGDGESTGRRSETL